MTARPTTLVIVAIAAFPATARAQAGLRIIAEQGSTRSISSEAASLTVTNGMPGFMSVATQRPFVLGWVPVVAGYGAATPIYGPPPLMPQYSPGPSVAQERIARLRQEGVPLVHGRGVARPHPPIRPTAWRIDDNTPRLAGALQSSAGQTAESIASIRVRQAQQEAAREQEIAELRRRMQEAEAASKPQVARIYAQQIERRGGTVNR